MKKLTAILFLFVFLCANTVFGQLLKLPSLIEHYKEHTADTSDDDHDISFLDFVKKHYSDSVAKSNETNYNHKQLPFKNIDCHTTCHIIAMPQYSFWQPVIPAVTNQAKKLIYSQQDYSSASLGNIWQPPRFS